MPTIGDNLAPVDPPANDAVLADLKRRYPQIDSKIKEFEDALGEYPTSLTLDNAEEAAALQDLLGQMRDARASWDGLRKSQKKPWDGIVKVVQNFFVSGQEKIEKLEEVWRPRYQVFLDLKTAENARKADEAAEAQRKEAERLAAEADAAAERKRKAEQAEAEARQREETARLAAELAERDRIAAEERAEAAKAEERRLADEKRERDNTEKAANALCLRETRALMKRAEQLNDLANADEATDAEIAELDGLVHAGKAIGNLVSPVANSPLLDEDQKGQIETVRARLGELRKAINARFDAAERRRREKARKEAEAADAAAAALRAAARAKEDEEHRKAKEARDAADAAAVAAKAAQKAAQTDVRAARTDARGAAADQKAAGKDEKRLGVDAERAENRADRLERRNETMTDADHSQTRGELGTVGGIVGRWTYDLADEEALRAVCGPLGPYLTTDALGGAAYRWMGAHRDGFPDPKDSERVEGKLAGVVFIFERDVAIR